MSNGERRLPPMQYLEWAIREMPRARLDLATSGVPLVSVEELGAIPRLGEWRAHLDLIAEVAARYGVREGEVVPALGAAGGLWLAATALVDAGDEVVAEEPAYEPVVRVFEGRGARVQRFRRSLDEAWTIDVDRVLATVGPRTRAVLVTNPHNPSGVHLSDEQLRPLADALAGRGVELVVDEVYRELCEPRACARRLGPHVSVVSSLTKCFGLGWARAGWVICRPELAERMRLATMHLSGVLPSTSSAIGACALRDVERLAARARAKISGKRERVEAWVSDNEQLTWQAPHPALHFGFVADRRGRDLSEALARAVSESGVLAVPGSFFGMPSAFRMSWTLPAELLDEALRSLGAALLGDR